MPDSQRSLLQLYNPSEETCVIERRLPHWSQAGTVCFITFRTWDSMPKSVVADWHAERRNWLRDQGIDPLAEDVTVQLDQLAQSLRREYYHRFSERWPENLDACHGECLLRQLDLAQIVADSLCHFDGIRYDLTDFIVMPNHAHLLVAFHDVDAMLSQCESWKRFTATKINRKLARRGRFWQQDGFDHLVRSIAQFDCLRDYIRENPDKAKLNTKEYLHFSKSM